MLGAVGPEAARTSVQVGHWELAAALVEEMPEREAPSLHGAGCSAYRDPSLAGALGLGELRHCDDCLRGGLTPSRLQTRSRWTRCPLRGRETHSLGRTAPACLAECPSGLELQGREVHCTKSKSSACLIPGRLSHNSSELERRLQLQLSTVIPLLVWVKFVAAPSQPATARTFLGNPEHGGFQ